jgi:MerR family transcriptional regulator, copper efflux regulator
MRVGDAARRVGTSTRMLRYAEQLGLVAPPRTAAGYRDYGERDLHAAAEALELQARHRVTPAALAFGLRALEDPEVAASLRHLARLARGPGSAAGLPRSLGGPAPAPVAALDFETAKARRLLRLAS